MVQVTSDIRSAIQKELAVRNAAKKSLLLFTQYTMPKYKVNWHHKTVCKILDKFARGEIKKLMVFQPPQTGKSELVSRKLPPYMLGNNPDLRIAICSYSGKFASKFNSAIQKTMDSDAFRNIFPEVGLGSRNSNYLRNNMEFEIVDHDGGLKTVGVGGPITGDPVHIGIIDDPIKDAKEAYSAVFRENLWEWYLTTFLTRLDDKSQQLICLTRWHEDDLAGRILEMEGDEWTVLKLPGINEDGPSEYDPREIGEVLWPQKHSLESYEKKRKRSPKTFMSMYQQEPMDKDGEILKRANFRVVTLDSIIDALDEPIHFIGDTAYKEAEENDPSAFLAYVKYMNNYYILDYIEGRWRFSMLIKNIINFVSAYISKMSIIWIENKASGVSTVQQLKDNTKYNVREFKEKGKGVDKVAKINSIEPIVSSDRIFLVKGKWNKKFIDDCVFFPKLKHDEAPDLLYMMLNVEETKPRRRRRSATR